LQRLQVQRKTHAVLTTSGQVYKYMERLACLIFRVFSLLFSNFKSLWTRVSCCVQKATRRVHYIGCYEHLIGRYGRIATRYVHITARYA